MAVDKQKAIELRLQGKNYEEIAKELSCSVAWCKANLKGIKQDNPDKPIIELIRKKGKEQYGITPGEIKALVMQAFPTLKGKELTDKIEAIKKASKRGCKEMVIRPYWMLPNNARSCTNTIMDMAQDVHERIQHNAQKYRCLYNLDNSYQSSIVYYLTLLASGSYSKLMPQGLAEYGEQLEAIIDKLETRNNEEIDHNILLFNSITETTSILPDSVAIGLSDGYECYETHPITIDDLDIPY